MHLRDNFNERVVVRQENHEWVDSPANGVKRMMLDRIGGEVARATTIVRFAPNSRFDAHEHDGGEEFLVLDGTFSDEHNDYPKGTYVRNPIGTSHTPHIGEMGATILVKLHQFAADDVAHFHVDTTKMTFTAGKTPGVEEALLHAHGSEKVRLVRLSQGGEMPVTGGENGAEIFVLEGAFSDAQGQYPTGTWLRIPGGSPQNLHSDTGCLLWIKTGHLGENLIRG